MPGGRGIQEFVMRGGGGSAVAALSAAAPRCRKFTL